MKRKILFVCFFSSFILGIFSQHARAEWWAWTAWHNKEIPVSCPEGVMVALQETGFGMYRIGCAKLPYAYLDQGIENLGGKCTSLGQCAEQDREEIKKLKNKNIELEEKLNEANEKIIAIQAELRMIPKPKKPTEKK